MPNLTDLDKQDIIDTLNDQRVYIDNLQEQINRIDIPNRTPLQEGLSYPSQMTVSSTHIWTDLPLSSCEMVY